MKKIITTLLIGIFLMSMVFAAQGNGQNNAGEEQNPTLMVMKRTQTGSFTTSSGEQVHVELQSNNRVRLRANNVEAETDLEILQEEGETDEDKTKLKVKLSNGRNAEVKVMPDTASERALERLRLHICSEENNCTIELKEVGNGEKMQLAYEIQAERHSKLLGMFRKKMQVRAQVDAETGELVRVNKPWWAFLATEPEEETETEEVEDDEELEELEE